MALNSSFIKLRPASSRLADLRPALQTHFDRALAHLEAGDYPAAKALFESLLTEIDRSCLRDRGLERRIYASHGQIALSLADNDGAIKLYKRAVEMDDDPVRAAVNSSVVDLIEEKPTCPLRFASWFCTLTLKFRWAGTNLPLAQGGPVAQMMQHFSASLENYFPFQEPKPANMQLPAISLTHMAALSCQLVPVGIWSCLTVWYVTCEGSAGFCKKGSRIGSLVIHSSSGGLE
jgi:tetratricopeptide (TPR) repeat protein